MSRKADHDHYTLSDAFTGVDFTPRTPNHYEAVDPVPKAPHVDVNRPTIRQRIENLTSRGIDPLTEYVRQHQGEDTLDFDVPDDPDAPITAAEAMHIDMVAAALAEQAPLPDEGLPRPQAEPPSPAPAAPSEAAPAASGGPVGAGPTSPVPTR